MLTVADDGPGIPAWLQPEIFERFARGDSSRSRRGGSTGLGLAIVAAVVRAHNGTIDVHSVPGQTGVRGEVSGQLTGKPQRGQNRRLAALNENRLDDGRSLPRAGPTRQQERKLARNPPLACELASARAWDWAVLLAATAALYLWNLSASGWANAFYSAAAQAGASDWTAMLFGSSDAANAITVDKTPAALWVIDVSVRLFGLNPWSVLVPQALEGVGAVALLYAAVRRVSGDGAALLAGAVFALTPVAALIFRFNNPDALLVLLLVAAAYCVQRACEKDSSRWWLIAAGVLVGFGFLAKMLQAFLVLPGFAAAYLVAGHRRMRRRIVDLLAAAAARRGVRRLVSVARRAVAGRRRGPTSAVRSTTASSNWRWDTTVSAA